MYRVLRVSYLLTYYCHCQKGTMRETEHESERIFIQGNYKVQASKQTVTLYIYIVEWPLGSFLILKQICKNSRKCKTL